MKLFISLLLTLIFILSLAACAAPANEPAEIPAPEQTAKPVNNFVGEVPLTLHGSFPAVTRVTLRLDTVYELDEDNCIFIGDGRAEFDLANHDGLAVNFSVPSDCI